MTICPTILPRAQFPAQASPAGRVGLPSPSGRSGQRRARPGGLRAGRTGGAGGGLRPVYCPGGRWRASGRPGGVSAGAADPRALAGCWRALAGRAREGLPGGRGGLLWASGGLLRAAPIGRCGRRPEALGSGIRGRGGGLIPAMPRNSSPASQLQVGKGRPGRRPPAGGGLDRPGERCGLLRGLLRPPAGGAGLPGCPGKEKPRRGGRGLWGASTGRGSTGRARRPPDRRGSRAATRPKSRRR